MNENKEFLIGDDANPLRKFNFGINVQLNQ